VFNPGKGERFSSLQSHPRPALRPTQPAFYGCRAPLEPFTGVNRSWHEAVHSAPSSAEFKNECNYTSTPPLRLHGVDKDTFNCTFTFTPLMRLDFPSGWFLSFGLSTKSLSWKVFLKLHFLTCYLVCSCRGAFRWGPELHKPKGFRFDFQWCHWNFSLT
jgi:hypothetical protein